jgi:Phage T4 tail fibre
MKKINLYLLLLMISAFAYGQESPTLSANGTFGNINIRANTASVPVIRFTRWTGGGSHQHNAYVGQFYNTALSEYSFGIGTGFSATGDQNFNNTVLTASLSGAIGIGTTTPGSKLDIQAEVGNSGLRIQGGQPYGTYYFDIAPFLQNNPWSVGYNLSLKTSSGMHTNFMSFIDGNVGIGITNPIDKLNVVGKQGLGSPGSAAGQLSLYPNNAASWFHIDNRNDNTLRISHGGVVGQVDLFALNSNGNVGIGTTSPDAKLAVKGTVHAQEVKVDLSVPGPDYVFEPTYQLPSLTEIETYIKANKHLPEVPSAKEMETNGINLSEMNMLLLKKVEELTLYQIEANKKIELLQNQVLELLQNRNKK